jgi:hypothetical protein
MNQTLAPVPPLAQWIRYDGYRRAVGVQALNGYWYNICHRNRTDSHRAPSVYVLAGAVGTDYGDGAVYYLDTDGNPCAAPADHGTAACARRAVVAHNARHGS